MIKIQARLGLCVALLPGMMFSQGICVPDPIEADRIEGVVLFEAAGESRPLPDVAVAIFTYSNQNGSPVATAMTDSDGHYSIQNPPPGRYWLSLQHRALIRYDTELRLQPQHTRTSAFLIATIRNDPNKPCGGGSVILSPVLDERCRSLEYQDQNQIDYGPLKVRQVRGTAMDMQATPIPRTCVGVFGEPGHNLVSSIETGEDGWFAFKRLKPGRYRLVAAYDHFGVANVLLDIASWPAGGIFTNRTLAVHFQPRGIDITSFVDYER